MTTARSATSDPGWIGGTGDAGLPAAPRMHGAPPYAVAVIHGGPGAVGEMAPVAEVLAAGRGILEPYQTAFSLEGQVDELARILREHASLPAVLIGHSWGAWLGAMVAAAFPPLVSRMIMVSAGPLTEEFTAGLRESRLRRLSGEDRREAEELGAALDRGTLTGRSFSRFGELMARADAFDPLPMTGTLAGFRPDIYQSVWPEALECRRSGALVRACRSIHCPIVAIHGEYDPHPADGVRLPLDGARGGFRFHLLGECGHTPWLERRAWAPFFELLEKEIDSTSPVLR